MYQLPQQYSLDVWTSSWFMVKTVPAMQETQEMWVQSLCWEDPLEEKMATHSSTLACEIPWTEEPGRLQPIGSQSFKHD